MYYTGTQYNLEERLHQTPTGFNDVQIYNIEARSYTIPFSGVIADLNREFRRKYLIYTGSALYKTGNFWNF